MSTAAPEPPPRPDRGPTVAPPRITLLRAVFSRRVLDRRITGTAFLVGVVLGAVVGQIAGSFVAGVWIGAVVGFLGPGPVAYLFDRAGHLPAGARYQRVSLREFRELRRRDR